MRAWIVVGLTLSSLAALPGCSLVGSSEPARFYLLTPIERPLASESKGPRVRIAAVELPQYLDTPLIVTRREANRLDRAEYDRWAEPLSENFASILATNLSRLLDSHRVSRRPWENPSDVDYRVRINVRRFDAAEGAVVLEAQWVVTAGEPHQLERSELALVRLPFDGEAPYDEDEFAEIVDAMSRALGELSQAIAAAIPPQRED